jgi:hypothetical protein
MRCAAQRHVLSRELIERAFPLKSSVRPRWAQGELGIVDIFF